MKVRVIRWYNALLTSLLALMGYGCSSDEPMDMYGTIVAMYGALVIKYSVKGNVTDEDGNPIKNIKASVKTGPYDEEETLTAIVGTDTPFLTGGLDELKQPAELVV